MRDRLAGSDSAQLARALATIEALECELAARPEDSEIRARLLATLGALTVDVRSVTRTQVLVITTWRQRQICEYAAERILALGDGDDELQASARTLLEEIRAGRRWVWERQGLAVALAAGVMVAGLTVVVLGALSASIVTVVLAGLLSSLALGAVVLRYRREIWRVQVEQAIPSVWRHGL